MSRWVFFLYKMWLQVTKGSHTNQLKPKSWFLFEILRRLQGDHKSTTMYGQTACIIIINMPLSVCGFRSETNHANEAEWGHVLVSGKNVWKFHQAWKTAPWVSPKPPLECLYAVQIIHGIFRLECSTWMHLDGWRLEGTEIGTPELLLY